MSGQIIIPYEVNTALGVLYGCGYEGYLVGGCVRDSLMGFTPHDYDVTTNARPEQILAAFDGYTVVQTGIKHGTVTVVVGGMPLEITSYRVDGVYADNRRPVSVTFTSSLSDDLCRRDFTVNAMAYSEKTGVVDLFGGKDDLDAGIIRCVGEPDKRFGEDGLRILRALRFASVLDFSVDAPTSDSVIKNRALLMNISAERIFAEFSKLICGRSAARIVFDYMDVLHVFAPGFHCERAEKLACMLNDIPARLAYLLYDYDNERSLYSQSNAENTLLKLKTDTKTIRQTCALITALNMETDNKKSSVKRLMNALPQELFGDFLSLYSAINPESDTEAIKKTSDEIIEHGDCYSMKMLALNGGDLLSIGVPQGSEVGRILSALLEAVIDGKCENNREKLLAYAEQQYNAGM